MAGLSRRSFIATATATVASLPVVGSVTAAPDIEGGEFANAGDEIERSDDLEELREYMPYLRFRGGSPSREQFIGLFGWKAESPEYDTDAYYFWARYTHQNAGLEELGFVDRVAGVLATDAHLFDHEPSITFVDADSGEVEEVVYTQGHHSVARDGNPPLIEDGVDGLETHVSLRVVDPWHHYDVDDEKRGSDTRNWARFDSWLEVRDRWIDNGFYENSNAEAIDNPWVARERDTWFEGSYRDTLAAQMWGFL